VAELPQPGGPARAGVLNARSGAEIAALYRGRSLFSLLTSVLLNVRTVVVLLVAASFSRAGAGHSNLRTFAVNASTALIPASVDVSFSPAHAPSLRGSLLRHEKGLPLLKSASPIRRSRFRLAYPGLDSSRQRLPRFSDNYPLISSSARVHRMRARRPARSSTLSFIKHRRGIPPGRRLLVPLPSGLQLSHISASLIAREDCFCISTSPSGARRCRPSCAQGARARPRLRPR
jgi:hypothetical protein